MGTKGKLTLYVDLELVKEAKELGLNISKVCENALKMAIEQLKPIYSKNKAKNCGEAGPLGFEPRISGSAGQRPNPC